MQAIRSYFSFLKEQIRTKKYKTIWSLDECGFSLKELQKLRVQVVGSKDSNGSIYIVLPEWQGHISVLAAISNTGRSLPPFWLIEGSRHTPTAAEIQEIAKRNGLDIPSSTFRMSGKNKDGKKLKGSRSREAWRDYFKNVFIPNIAPAEYPALVTVDGHNSHFDMEFLLQCKAKGIDVVQEPSNCSSVLQALDQTVFKILKQGWRAELVAWKNKRENRFRKLSKFEVPYLCKAAWERAMTKKNILASFKRCGLDTLDVEIPLARIRQGP